MSEYLLPLLLMLLLLAAYLDDIFLFKLLYLLLGGLLAGRWWSVRALERIQVRREGQRRLFLGEKIEISLVIVNRGWLPLVWLQVQENLPAELGGKGGVRQVLSLGPKGRARFTYSLDGRKRGYYEVGPTRMYSGDLLGLVESSQRVKPADHVTVYPKIIPLRRVDLPSNAPLGTLRHRQPLYADPTRVAGKREYQSGDSLRRVDWKATAASGALQVKLFDPAISLETAILLDLNLEGYHLKGRFADTEFAIIVAASLANWVAGKRQALGLITNGADPLLGGNSPAVRPPKTGRGVLMGQLDVLARIQARQAPDVSQVLQTKTTDLAWGTTLVVITGIVHDEVISGLLKAHRRGLTPALVQVGRLAGRKETRTRVGAFGVPYFGLQDERDLDQWRG